MGSTEMANDYDYLIKLLIIGDHGVGKDCLLSRFADESLTPITEGDCKTRTIEIDRKRIMLKIWVIVGQELDEIMFDTLIPAYFVEAMGYLMVYDVTDKSSFNNIRNYIKRVWRNHMILVGNKADMDESERAVRTSKGQALADECGIKFFETSAKTCLNVDKVFVSIARDIKQRLTESDSKTEIKQLEDSQEKKLNGINETEESLKKAKEEKKILCYENEQLKQHISTLKYDLATTKDQIQRERDNAVKQAEENKQLGHHISILKNDLELALLEKAALTTMKDHIQDERDNVVKEAEELRRQMKLSQTSNFTWQELNKSTLGFSESLKIGEGGYGRVYKGNLRGTNVAIKVLNSEKTAPLSAFKQENLLIFISNSVHSQVVILTTFRHPNLVTLIGACYEYSALVYEFLPNGSLEDHLSPMNNITPLRWQVRTRIMHEICLALIFLHSNKPNIVIHGDLKPDNVLLDANFVSKLGDFGISRLVNQSDKTACYMTKNIVGTPGYMDPDFIYNGQLTEKSDVFSFGVIILRLLTGQSAMGVVYRVQDAMQSQTLDNMIDKSAGEWPLDQAKKLAVLGLRCTEMSRKDRPNLFNEVWPIFEGLQRNI